MMTYWRPEAPRRTGVLVLGKLEKPIMNADFNRLHALFLAVRRVLEARPLRRTNLAPFVAALCLATAARAYYHPADDKSPPPEDTGDLAASDDDAPSDDDADEPSV